MSQYKEFADKLIENIKDGTAPWQKTWQAGELIAPYNASTQKNYSGANFVALLEKDYNDPRWLTIKQANKLGYSVQKGEKSSQIIYWDIQKDNKAQENNKLLLKEYDVENKNELPEAIKKEIQAESKPFLKQYNVFNGTQLNGIDKFDKDSMPTWEISEQAEKFLKIAEQTNGLSIKHDQRDGAFFRPSDNSIHMPDKASFKNNEEYYTTIMHELSHWASHNILANEKKTADYQGDYAREELRAEIATFMLSAQLRLPHNPQNSEAYIDSWLKHLDKDPYEIVRASRDAEKIKDSIICLDKDLVKTFNLEEVAEANKLNLDTWQYREYTHEYNDFLDKQKYAQVNLELHAVQQELPTISDKNYKEYQDILEKVKLSEVEPKYWTATLKQDIPYFANNPDAPEKDAYLESIKEPCKHLANAVENYKEQLDVVAENQKNSPPTFINKIDCLDTANAFEATSVQYKDFQGLAYAGKGKLLETNSNTQTIAKELARQCHERGFNTIKVTATYEFSKEVWREGSARDMNVKGYVPDAKDVQEVKERLEQQGYDSVKSAKIAEEKGINSGYGSKELNDTNKAEALKTMPVSQALNKYPELVKEISVIKAGEEIIKNYVPDSEKQAKAIQEFRNIIADKMDKGQALPDIKITEYQSKEKTQNREQEQRKDYDIWR